MKIKKFNLFVNESQTTEEAKKGFDWFNQNYLTNNGWTKKDKVGSHFEHISSGGGFFHIVYKEDPQAGDGFELSETIGKETTVIKTIFEKEKCWDWFTTWMKQTLDKPKDVKPDPKTEPSTFHKVVKFLAK